MAASVAGVRHSGIGNPFFEYLLRLGDDRSMANGDGLVRNLWFDGGALPKSVGVHPRDALPAR